MGNQQVDVLTPQVSTPQCSLGRFAHRPYRRLENLRSGHANVMRSLVEHRDIERNSTPTRRTVQQLREGPVGPHVGRKNPTIFLGAVPHDRGARPAIAASPGNGNTAGSNA